MKVLYLGTILPKEKFNSLNKSSKTKASAAPQIFETQFISELSKYHDLDISLLSFTMVSSFPSNKKLIFKHHTKVMFKKVPFNSIPFVNFHIAKQISMYFASRRLILKWIKSNINNSPSIIIIYSLYYPIARSIIKLSRKHNIKTMLILPDFPQHLYDRKAFNPLMKLLTTIYIKKSNELLNHFSSYVFFTKQMNHLIQSKNSIIIEGIYDLNTFNGVSRLPIRKTKSILYAGALDEINGLKILIDAFTDIEGDYELWLFGMGNCQSYIEKASSLDSRIKYFGVQSREIVLKYELSASLLVNLRKNESSHTAYSFPSKTIEFMASGTPLLTTKLDGIPDEYYKFVYLCDDLRNAKNIIKEILEKNHDELYTFGQNAKNFISENKSCKIQIKKVRELIQKTVKEGN